MNLLSNLKSTAQGLSGKTTLAGMKYGPHVMMGLGIVGYGVSMYLTYKAALKVEGVNAEAKENFEKIQHGHETYDPECYSEQDYKEDLKKAVIKKYVNLAIVFAPAIGMGVISTALVLGSHGILTQRNLALVAAYKALDLGFRSYRKNVIAEFGPEKDEEFRFGKKTKVLELQETNESGEIVKKQEEVPAHLEASIYARWFDKKTSSQFRDDPIHSLNYLTNVQNHMNDILQSRGFVFLNEVYNDLGMEWSTAGQIVGWRKDGDGNGYVDFGLHAPRNILLMQGKEATALLDFNVDGIMADAI